jgi:hypothetical protein
MIDMGADPAHRPLAAPSKEVHRLRVLEERVHGTIEVAAALGNERRNPARGTAIQLPRQADEAPQIGTSGHWAVSSAPASSTGRGIRRCR